MPLIEPTLDPRKYREILAEALARIPAHNPEWTNFNDSDPGITVLQLFAFMTESITYRANLIPERNRRKYLRLLGLPMLAPAAARGLVSFEKVAGDLAAQVLAPDLALYAGNVPFRTENGLEVLPVEARLYYKSPLSADRAAEVDTLYSQLYASQLAAGEVAEYYETKVFEPPTAGTVLPSLDLSTDTVDGSLWVALLARPREDVAVARTRIAGRTLSLGVMPSLDDDGKALYPRGGSAVTLRPTLIFELPNAGSAQPAYRRISPRVEVDPLSRPGIVELPLPEAAALDHWTDLDPLEAGVGDYPPSLADREEAPRLITWLRIRSPEAFGAGSAGSRQLRVPLAWVGINAATVVQRAQVLAEALPIGTGEPDQRAVLVNTPVIVESVALTVNGEPWERIDDLGAAAAEVPPRSPRLTGGQTQPASTPTRTRVYTVDRESGELRFGDGLHGMRPPRGAAIQASYAYGGGTQGNLGIGAVDKGAPSGLKVRSRVPTWGGSEGESLAQAERRIPGFLRHRDRLVTAEDYREITAATPGVDIGRVEVLPLVHPEQPFQDSEGVVTLLVVPRNDATQPEAPRPDRLFLETLCAHLEPRRLLTTELHLVGPVYEPIWISVGVEVIPGRPEGVVREAVRKALLGFVSPLTGGFEGRGWPLHRAVEAAELVAAAARVGGVAKVNQLRLGSSTGEVPASVPIDGLQLPRVMAVEVVSGDAPSIESLQGRSPLPVEPGAPVSRPLPVIPETC